MDGAKYDELLKKVFFIVLIILTAGMLLPQNPVMPVLNATASDYHPDSFWYEPWGKSGTHKGVDIFAKRGQEVLAATGGMVIYSGTMKYGGEVIMVLGPKWRIHYYAHLNSRETGTLSWVSGGDTIGGVGDSGNARGKQPHLHYSITTMIPYPWRFDRSTQGWKKMFYLNPTDFF